VAKRRGRTNYKVLILACVFVPERRGGRGRIEDFCKTRAATVIRGLPAGRVGTSMAKVRAKGGALDDLFGVET